jgi:hypothetical protein
MGFRSNDVRTGIERFSVRCQGGKRYNELEETTNVGLATVCVWDKKRDGKARMIQVRCVYSLSPLIRCILLRFRSI